MDVFTIRNANLQFLLEELRDRGITRNIDAAQALGGIGESYLSQLKSGKRMGEATARKIERAIRRPEGWMDLVHSPNSTSAHGKLTQTIAEESPVYKAGHAGLSKRDQALLRDFHAASELGKVIIEAAAKAAASH